MNHQKDAITMRRRSIKRETIGNVEFTTDGERLTLRYTGQFTRRAAFILLLITLLAGALLTYPVLAIVRGHLLEVITLAVFLFIMGGVVAAAAVAGWLHLSLFALRPIIFDRGAGICTIPRRFWCKSVLPLAEIESVLLRRNRKDVGEGYASSGIDRANLWSAYYSERDSILLVMRGTPKGFQRLWGRLGLTAGAEPVARHIATFLGRRFERRPAHYFAREPHHAA